MHLPHVQPFARCPLYFFTMCTAGRRHLLANDTVMNCLREIWENSPERNGWAVGKFVIMPDHVHFFARSSMNALGRAEWLKMTKSISARRLVKRVSFSSSLWQAGTFDHILRSAESYRAKWEYVEANPVRAGLVASADQWRWQGEVEILRFGTR